VPRGPHRAPSWSALKYHLSGVRLAGFATLLDQEVGIVRHDLAMGVTPPDFVLAEDGGVAIIGQEKGPVSGSRGSRRLSRVAPYGRVAGTSSRLRTIS
jgi:hypothetical protein